MKERWYKKPGNIVTLVLSIILIPIILLNLSIIIQSNTSKDKVPSVFGYKPFMVLSGSMESKIRKGDLIVVKMVEPSTLKQDDVIAFRDQQNTVTTHRIIEIINRNGNTYFVTKGDNNDSQDQNLVEYKDVEGIYVFRVPGLGNVLKSLSEPTTIIIIVFGITIVFGLGFVKSMKKQSEQDRQEFLEYKKQKELLEQQEALKKQPKKETKKQPKKETDKKSSKK